MKEADVNICCALKTVGCEVKPAQFEVYGLTVRSHRSCEKSCAIGCCHVGTLGALMIVAFQRRFSLCLPFTLSPILCSYREPDLSTVQHAPRTSTSLHPHPSMCLDHVPICEPNPVTLSNANISMSLPMRLGTQTLFFHVGLFSMCVRVYL